MFLGKWVRSNSCAGKTARYTDKGNLVDTQFTDVCKMVESVPHYTDHSFAQCSEKGAHINWVNHWLYEGSQYLFAKQKLWLSTCALHQLAVGSSELCVVGSSGSVSGQPRCAWGHSGVWGWGRSVCHGSSCKEPEDCHCDNSSTKP